MDIALLAGGVFAVAVIVLADRVDAVVDTLHTSDDPLTDFDAELDAEPESGDDAAESLDDA
ncbi:hypothetical protein BRC64_09870 [Halobacteriales archaeon QH_10_67_22]|nr:MAG: hypothetical protein BRC64_09870 [Halobacteriales archaeon QH_10_67_22]